MKIGVCGHFNLENEAIGGQTIRTRIIKKELEDYYGEQNIEIVDTNGWKRKPFSLFFKCIKLAERSSEIIILPAHNGIKVFIPLFVLIRKLFSFKLHYVVVGAWLKDDLARAKWLILFVKKIDFIYVQTETLKRSLGVLSINSGIYILPNFKSIEPIKIEKIEVNVESNFFRVCTLSRVTKMKGISDAINVVVELNSDIQNINVILDIYGHIEKGYETEFNELLKENSDFIRYKGVLDNEKCVSTLKEYDLLLFPTKYYTEGFPGTIIDSFFAGVPVLASRWESSVDVITENQTGITYEFNNVEDFKNKLKNIIFNRTSIYKMKFNCVEESHKYASMNAMRILVANLGSRED